MADCEDCGNLYFNNIVTKSLQPINSDDRYFEGYLTVQVKDKQGEITIVDELYKVLPVWMDRGAPISDTHSNRIVGKGINYSKTTFVDKDGSEYPAIKITGKIHKNYELDHEIWTKIKSGEYKGLSFGGATRTNREPIVMKDGSIAYALKELEHYEVAVCRDPAVPLALITDHNAVAKAIADYTEDRGDKMVIKCSKFGCYVEKKDSPCWEGYEMVGYKMKDGKRVPNCVPIKNKKKSHEEDVEVIDKDPSGGTAETSDEIMEVAGRVARKENPEIRNIYQSEPDPEQLKMGIKVEMEHTDDKEVAEKIARDHLKEVPDYYTKLKEVEKADEDKPLNKPMRDDGDKKFKVYVRDPKTGNVVTVRFGDPNMEIKRDDPERRASFRARHDCENAKDITSAQYWSCKMWEKSTSVTEYTSKNIEDIAKADLASCDTFECKVDKLMAEGYTKEEAENIAGAFVKGEKKKEEGGGSMSTSTDGAFNARYNDEEEEEEEKEKEKEEDKEDKKKTFTGGTRHASMEDQQGPGNSTQVTISRDTATGSDEEDDVSEKREENTGAETMNNLYNQDEAEKPGKDNMKKLEKLSTKSKSVKLQSSVLINQLRDL